MSRAGVIPRQWTADEDAIVRAAHGVVAASDVAERIGRSVRSVQQRAVTLGLTAGSAGLPAAPLAAAVRRWLDTHAGIAQRDLVSTHTLAAWDLPCATVRGDAADRWVCRMDCLWFDVWDLEDPAAIAFFVGPEELAA